MTNGENITDHDRLIRIDERTSKVDRCLTNHLHHHWIITAAALGACFTATALLLASKVFA